MIYLVSFSFFLFILFRCHLSLTKVKDVITFLHLMSRRLCSKPKGELLCLFCSDWKENWRCDGRFLLFANVYGEILLFLFKFSSRAKSFAMTPNLNMESFLYS